MSINTKSSDGQLCVATRLTFMVSFEVNWKYFTKLIRVSIND